MSNVLDKYAWMLSKQGRALQSGSARSDLRAQSAHLVLFVIILCHK